MNQNFKSQHTIKLLNKPYGYILLDLNQNIQEDLPVVMDIFDN